MNQNNLFGKTDIEIVMDLLKKGGFSPFKTSEEAVEPVMESFVKYAETVLENIQNPFAKRLLTSGIEEWKVILK